MRQIIFGKENITVEKRGPIEVYEIIERYGSINGLPFLLCEQDGKAAIHKMNRDGSVGALERQFDCPYVELSGWVLQCGSEFQRWATALLREEDDAWVRPRHQKLFGEDFFIEETYGGWTPYVKKGYVAIPLFNNSGTKYTVVPEEKLATLHERFLQHCECCKKAALK